MFKNVVDQAEINKMLSAFFTTITMIEGCLITLS